MRKVLVPTDFSENAYNALSYAVQFFFHDECTFFLLNTYTVPVYQSEFSEYSPSQIDKIEPRRTGSMASLNKMKNDIQNKYRNPEHTFVTRSALDTPVSKILDIIKDERIDVVVMGTQGATGAKEILLGSNTVHVITKANCPVIAVPASYAYKTPKEILFPTDFEIDYQKNQLQLLLNAIEQHKAIVNILHIRAGYDLSEPQKINKSKLLGLIAGSALLHELPDKGIIKSINDFLTNGTIDFLVMIQNKHGFFERLFREPIVKKIGFHVKIPFMVIPYHTKK